MSKLNIEKLAHEMQTQDNLCTADPIYLVQEERIIYGFQPECAADGDYHWYFPDEDGYYDVPTDGEGLPLSEEEAEIFGYEKAYFITTKEFVCAHFTMAAAERYIEAQKHNLKSPRIFVDSMYRCDEMKAIREFLMNGEAAQVEQLRSVCDELTARLEKTNNLLKMSEHLHWQEMVKECPENDRALNRYKAFSEKKA